MRKIRELLRFKFESTRRLPRPKAVMSRLGRRGAERAEVKPPNLLGVRAYDSDPLDALRQHASR